MYHKMGQNTTRVRRAAMEMKEKSGHVWIYAARVRRAGEQQRTWMQLKESFLVVVIRHVKFPHSPPSDGILMWYWENWDNGNVQSSVCKHAELETWWDANSEPWPGWSCTYRQQEVHWQSSRTFTQLKLSLKAARQPVQRKLETVEDTDMDAQLQQVLHVLEPAETFHEVSSACWVCFFPPQTLFPSSSKQLWI